MGSMEGVDIMIISSNSFMIWIVWIGIMYLIGLVGYGVYMYFKGVWDEFHQKNQMDECSVVVQHYDNKFYILVLDN